MASYDKAIPPGGEGRITLRVRTKGYQGKIYKSAKVNTNDPRFNVVRLRIKGFVKVPIYLSARGVYLRANEGGSVSKSVEIKAGLDRPLTLKPIGFSVGDRVSYRIEEVEKGKRFKIHFTSLPGPPQNYKGFLKLKTNYPEKPKITIKIRGQIAKNVKR